MKIFVSSRSRREYVEMFRLTEADLNGRILDCASGASTFASSMAAEGADVVAADPIYSASRADVRKLVDAGVAQARANVVLHPEQYNWDGPIRTVEAHADLRQRTAAAFLADYFDPERPSRYVAASFLALPFQSGAFDLVLSSHLLFTYAGTLSDALHVDAVREMLRVTRREVRIYPTIGFAGDATGALNSVRDFAAACKVTCVVEEVPYRFLRGSVAMLRLVKGYPR